MVTLNGVRHNSDAPEISGALLRFRSKLLAHREATNARLELMETSLRTDMATFSANLRADFMTDVRDFRASLMEELKSWVAGRNSTRRAPETAPTDGAVRFASSTPISDPEIEIVHSHLYKARCKQVVLKSTAVTGGVQKRRRSRPGNIGSLATCKHLKGKVSFQRLVAEIAQDVKADWRFQTVVPPLLQLDSSGNSSAHSYSKSNPGVHMPFVGLDSMNMCIDASLGVRNEVLGVKKDKMQAGDVNVGSSVDFVQGSFAGGDYGGVQPLFGQMVAECHALKVFDEMPKSKGLCSVEKSVTSVRDKGGGLAHQPVEHGSGENCEEKNEGIGKSVGKTVQLEEGNAIVEMEISTQLMKEDMLKGAPKRKDLAQGIVLPCHNYVNESVIKCKGSWDKITLEKVNDASLKHNEGYVLFWLCPSCGQAEQEEKGYWMYKYDDSVSLLDHDIKPGPLDQFGLNCGSGNICEPSALRVERMLFQVTNRKMLCTQAPENNDGYDTHADDHSCHLHSIFMEPPLAFYLRCIHRHPILGRYELLAKVSSTVLKEEKYIFGIIVNRCTAWVFEFGPSGIVELPEKWSLDAMNMKLEVIIKIIGCTMELDLPVNFLLEKHMQRGEKCWRFHYDQGHISSCIQFNNSLVYGNVEGIVLCCSTLLQWVKLQLYVVVGQKGINQKMHISLCFQAVVDLPLCTIIEFGIVATLNVWMLWYEVKGNISVDVGKMLKDHHNMVSAFLNALGEGGRQPPLLLPYVIVFVMGEVFARLKLLPHGRQINQVDIKAFANVISQLHVNEPSQPTVLIRSNGMRVCYKGTNFLDDQIMLAGFPYLGYLKLVASKCSSGGMGPTDSRDIVVYGHTPSVLMDMLALCGYDELRYSSPSAILAVTTLLGVTLVLSYTVDHVMMALERAHVDICAGEEKEKLLTLLLTYEVSDVGREQLNLRDLLMKFWDYHAGVKPKSTHECLSLAWIGYDLAYPCNNVLGNGGELEYKWETKGYGVIIAHTLHLECFRNGGCVAVLGGKSCDTECDMECSNLAPISTESSYFLKHSRSINDHAGREVACKVLFRLLFYRRGAPILVDGKMSQVYNIAAAWKAYLFLGLLTYSDACLSVVLQDLSYVNLKLEVKFS